jgi:hypothetical protein
MEKIMILKAVSPLKEREYPDQQTGEMRKVHWVELELTDGVDTVIGELNVRPQRGVNGQTVITAPTFNVNSVHSVRAELTASRWKSKDGNDGYTNRVMITKIVQL